VSLARIHIVTREGPLEVMAFYSIQADCGKLVRHPTVALLWDSQMMEAAVEWSPVVCAKCCKISDEKGARYVYGIHEGQG
jgi:hypothetical protein